MKGFTIIEFLISVAIIFSIGALGLFISLDFYKSSSLDSERQTAISLLQKVRNLSMTNTNEAKMEFILMPINIRFFKEKIIHRAIRFMMKSSTSVR